MLQSSADKDGSEVINDFDIDEDEILIENRLGSSDLSNSCFWP